MSGAGYDIEEEHRQSELRWAKLDHAVQLALNYFKQRPVPIEHAEYVRAFVLERAQKNYERVGGDTNDYLVQLQVNSIPHTEFWECVQQAATIAEHPLTHETLDQSFSEPPADAPADEATTTGAAGGGSV